MMPLALCGVVLVFYLLHLLSLWPLPLDARTLVSSSTTLWFVFEVSFFVYFRHHVRNMQWLEPPPPVSAAQRRRVMGELLRSMAVDRPDDCGLFDWFIRGWFMGAPLERVRRGNILHFLAWALFYRFPAQLSSEEVRELDEHIDRLQRAARHVFPLGFNADVRCIRLSLDPLKAMHRPLFLYGLVAVANSAARVVLQWRGFQRKQVGGFRYWHWAPGAQAEPKFPLVFMHGLGHGLVHYLHFLKPLRDHPLFLVELPHVSTRVWERVPTPEETVGAVHIMLTEHNFTRAVFIGHSYGTINVAWALKLRPAMVQSALLIDPVSLLLCLPKVAYSFVYRRPDTLLTWISFLFFSRELGISRTMSRAFWWQTNALSLSDIPCFPRTDRLGARGPPCERPDCCLRAPAEAAAPGSVMAATVHAARDLSTLPFFAWDRPSTAPRPAATPRAARALPDEVTLPTAPEPPAAGCARLKVAVVLSGEDTLVPSAHILRHLQLFRAELGASLRVLHFPTHGHARFLVDRRASEQIIALVPWLDAV